MTSKGAMMRKGILLIGSMAAIILAGAVWAKTVPPTPRVPFPSKGATLYKTTIVHAMQPCQPQVPGAVTLHLKGLAGGQGPLLGCASAPGDKIGTDTLRFQKGQLALQKKRGTIVLNIQGLPISPAAQVQVGLTLQSSREKANFKEGSDKNVTFLPLTVTCPVATANAKGKIVQKTNLDACTPLLTPVEINPLGTSSGGSEEKTLDLQLEVRDAVLLDHLNGKCLNGANDGLACTTNAECPPDDPGICGPLCWGGSDPGEPCKVTSECGLGGECRGKCVGGSNNHNQCRTDADCPSGKCGGACLSGANAELPCATVADCPDLNPGTCNNVFGRAGIAR
jgi:hypothetical protein